MHDQDFERLFEEHAGPLLGFLVYRTGDRALAEDVLATAFERALRARRRFDRRKASEKTWLYAIALNCLKDEARRRSAEARALERAAVSSAEPRGWTADVEDRELLGAALGELAPEEREAVALRFGADLTVPEIARLLGVSLTTAEGRVYRALRKLRERLDA
jgi:RNA polymerase sigma-70 factor (ECF subfamily)